MQEFWTGKNASRKFVDLIWKSSTKWAVWEPACTNIEVGDYGTVDKETGVFEREGNIFTTAELADLVKDVKPSNAHSRKMTDDVISITSLNARQVELGNSLGVDAQIAEASFKSTWKFGESTGAVLVAHQPHHTILPPEIKTKKLKSHPALTGMYLVTSVTTCPSYALYLTSKGDTELSLALCTSIPVAPCPVPVKVEVSNAWRSNYGGGYFRSGNRPEDSYTVLFDLKRCDKKRWSLFRDSPSPVSEMDDLDDACPPWEPLDDEGNEEDLSIYVSPDSPHRVVHGEANLPPVIVSPLHPTGQDFDAGTATGFL